MNHLSLGITIAWQIAAQEAALASYQYIKQGHILIGICSIEKVINQAEKVNLASSKMVSLQNEFKVIEDSLISFGTTPTQFRRTIRKVMGVDNFKHIDRTIHRSPECKQAFEKARDLARSDGGTINCCQLFIAILEQKDDVIYSTLDEMKIDVEDLQNELMERGNILFEELEDVSESKIHAEAERPGQASKQYLDLFCRDLTQEAQKGKLGPFVGRRKELLEIIQTLTRPKKNNPILIGEAGVGKTAIVEALALRITQKKDPQILNGKRILELNMANLVSGTKFRGDFEERLSNIIDEVQSHPEVILFIDEIHNMVGAGRAEGSMDAANIMKPALARGDLHCIGATTISEYRSFIEKDPALERRFEKIVINEPSAEETLDILSCLKEAWEEHYQIKIDKEALQTAVDLSIRFDNDHRLPDKAIDLVDKAGAHARVPFLSRQSDDLKKIMEAQNNASTVTSLSIAQVLSEKVGIPLEIITGFMQGTDNTRLLQLEPFLKERIKGQEKAIERICTRIQMAHVGLVQRPGPLAVFLFLGPTGVGKTETARTIAEFLFGRKSDVIRLDMSEFMEESSVAKLIGSAPGYVGYEDEGQLTGKLRTKPYSVVLLDEIEKAHPKIFDIFLQVFDYGFITDSKGREVNAKNSIFIMTSNLYPNKFPGIGFVTPEQSDDSISSEEIKQTFRREFINRIDEQVVFNPLDEKAVREILKPMLSNICNNLQRKYQITLLFDEKVEIYLAQLGYSPKYGARELRRVVEREIQIPISQLLLDEKTIKHKKWQISCEENQLVIHPID